LDTMTVRKRMPAKSHSGLLVVMLALGATSCSPPTASPLPGGTVPSGSLDIVVSSFTNRPSPVHVGSRVVFDYAIRNMGTTTIAGGTYSTDLYIDGRDVSFDHATSTIQPGDSIPYSMAPGHFHWQPTNSGRYHYSLVIVGGGMTNNSEGEIDVLP
jgi:hypothetical protein